MRCPSSTLSILLWSIQFSMPSAAIEEQMVPTYYEVLGLSTTATTTEIRSAFYRLAKSQHPDHQIHRHESTGKASGRHDEYIMLRTAYDTLRDDESRQAYDLAGHDTYVVETALRDLQGGKSQRQDEGLAEQMRKTMDWVDDFLA